jgi:WhiB family redox-sensing transcriptional regulator
MRADDDILRRLFVRADWMADAACRGMDINIFFPPHGSHGNEAKAVCAVCPVAEQCEQYALDAGERSGIWGGYSIDRRQRRIRGHIGLSGRPSGGQPKPINHGTLAGYLQEKRRGMPHCDDCRTARTEHRRMKRAEGHVA